MTDFLINALAGAIERAREDRKAMRCSICGDDTADPADCPDRAGWEDHGTCCVGKCQVCRGLVA